MAGDLTKVFAAARANLGYKEGPGENQNKFSAYWHHPAEPWCADSAAYMLKQGNALDVTWSAFTPSFAKAYQDVGRWGHSPKIGAVVFFQWPGMGRIAHVGLVESLRPDGRIITLEGNTDVAGGRTGGQYMRKVRGANIAGYGYPIYAPVTPVRHGDPVLKRGDRGQAVLNVQRALNLCGNHIALDGQFGADTDRILRTFQTHRGLQATGTTTAQTWAELRKVAHG